MKLVIGHRFQHNVAPGSMGVVTDTRYILCYWPKLDYPVKLFAEGSSGIEVIGSSRNVWFPDDTKWLDYHPDALYPAELAVGRRLINLTDAEALVWQEAYDNAVASFPPTHAIHTSRRDCLFVRHKDGDQEYISELTTDQAKNIADDDVNVDVLKLASDFVKLSDPLPKDDPSSKVYVLEIVDGAVVVVDKPQEPIEVLEAKG